MGDGFLRSFPSAPCLLHLKKTNGSFPRFIAFLKSATLFSALSRFSKSQTAWGFVLLVSKKIGPLCSSLRYVSKALAISFFLLRYVPKKLSPLKNPLIVAS